MNFKASQKRSFHAVTKVPSLNDRVIGADVSSRLVNPSRDNKNGNGNCPICKTNASVITDSKAGNRICAGCGYIFENSIISTEQEWRSFAASDDGGGDKSRVGGPTDNWLKDGTGGTSLLGGTGSFKKLGMVHDMTTASVGK